MSVDRLLNTVLQYYQDVHDAAKTDQIIGTTAHLLTQLSNPLNLGVLTSQLLTAPAIWQQHDGLRTAIRIISIYNTAATRIRENEIESARPKGQPKEGSGLSSEVWTRAVVKGLDEFSKRWQHLLVLTGVLMGMEGNDRRSLSSSLRGTLEHAVAMAANMALETHEEEGPLAGASIVMTLNYAFPMLSDFHKAQINCNALLPLTIWAITGPEGFAEGQFLHAISQNVVEKHSVYSWDAQSPSFQLLQGMEKQPLMGNMGPLSKLAAYTAQHATVTGVVMAAQDALLIFTRQVLEAWQSNPFSDIDPAFEEHKISFDAAKVTYPALWQTLRKLMFAVVAVLQAIVSRSLLDRHMLYLSVASGIAVKSLHILRNIYFISSRNGNNGFQVYTFAYLTSIDVLGRHPLAAEAFLKESQPLDSIPATHIARVLDLFYLNVAEHLPLVLSTEACDALIIKPATNYLSHGGTMTPFLVELFESSHSAILSVLSCPLHSALTIKITPFYIVKLLESFPERISPRQFRLAFKTVMQVVSPPFPIAAMEPHMSETLLEMLLGSISTAAREPLPTTPEAAPLDNPTEQVPEPFSEQSALTMTLVDALPYLPLPLVEEWLTITAQSLNNITDKKLRAPVKQRFWDILVNGEMDVERAAIGVSWWGSQGGREIVLFGGRHDPALMSGALVDEKISSRL